MYGDSGVEDSLILDYAKIYGKAEIVSSEVGNYTEICGKSIIIHDEIYDDGKQVIKDRNDIYDY